MDSPQLNPTDMNTTSANPQPVSLEDCVRDSLQIYFSDLDGAEPSGLHAMLVRAVERPLLELVMQQAGTNQSRAAQWLGLNRNTLRKKLLEHGLLDAGSKS